MQGRESGLSFAAGSELTIAAVPRRKLAGAGSVRPHAGSRYDRYELIHPIGEGGMGTVWLARMRGEHGFERVVALKVLLPSFVRDLRYRSMFIDEARIASRVVHANVAQVIDLGEKDGNLYLVMEWVNGDSLGNLLRAATAQSRTVPLTVLLRIFADVCAGFTRHDLVDQRGQPLNVVHRDVSPQNILVTDAGTVKVIDFGVVKARGRVAEDTSLEWLACAAIHGARARHWCRRGSPRRYLDRRCHLVPDSRGSGRVRRPRQSSADLGVGAPGSARTAAK